MPIYEYRCADCGHIFEEIQQFSDPDPEACPVCEASDVGRLVSRSNFQLRGGGWYADEYNATSTSGGAPSTTTSTSSSDTADSSDSPSTTTDSSSTKSDTGGTTSGEAAAAE